jgi:hypothetical protein
MRQTTKGIILALCATSAAVIGALGYLYWWPVPTCSEDEFDLAVHIASDVLDVQLVSKRMTPLEAHFLPGLSGTRRRVHDVTSPPLRMSIGSSDPRLARYSLQTTNSQAYVMAFISRNRVVGIGVQVFGRRQLADAIDHLLKNWVPTAELPIDTRLSDSPLWKTEDTHAEPGS